MEDIFEGLTNSVISHFYNHRFKYQLGVGILAVIGLLILGDHLFSSDNSYRINLFTEAISIGITVFIIDTLARRRDSIRSTNKLKADIQSRMRSKVNDVVRRAVEELRENEWTEDEFVKRAYLAGGNFQNISLAEIDFKGSSFMSADLRGTDFSEANLKWVDFSFATFDENTVLPDGSKWLDDSSLDRFTDPKHPRYWRSTLPYSPAYRGRRWTTDLTKWPHRTRDTSIYD